MAAYSIDECTANLERMDTRVTEIVKTRPAEHWQTSFWPMYPNVRKTYANHHTARCCYYGVATHDWMREHDEMTVRRPTLALVWRHWRNVLASREALADLGGPISANAGGIHMIELGNVPTQERLDAMLAVDRAEALYDRIARAFEGRQPPTWQQMLDGPRIKPPTRPEPTERNRTRRAAAQRASMNWK
jgi:hypothetical protein